MYVVHVYVDVYYYSTRVRTGTRIYRYSYTRVPSLHTLTHFTTKAPGAPQYKYQQSAGNLLSTQSALPQIVWEFAFAHFMGEPVVSPCAAHVVSGRVIDVFLGLPFFVGVVG